MIDIRDHADGCVLSVRAQPAARRNAIVGEQAGALKVAVTAPPDKGRANDAIIEVLAEALGVKRSQLSLVGGMTSRAKKVLIAGMKAADLRNRLQSLMENA